jgi:CBS domain containing-hemolysin-like protein
MASFVSTVVMTVVILIFGEIVPKIIAKNNADSAVRLFAWPTRILTWILYPLVWLVMRLIRLLSSLWGRDAEDAPTVTEEELSTIIETAEEEGVVDEEKSELLQSAIDFRDTTVEEIMTPRIDMTAFDIADSPEEIAELVNESRYSRIPVYEDSIDNIIGILYLNHYYKRLTDSEGPFSLRDLLMKPSFIHKTMKLPAALEEMRRRKIHLAVVMDEYGGTLGIVTLEDILEQIVGDIWDETDEIVHEMTKTGENTYEAVADMNVYDFFEELDVDTRDFDSEYTSLGGWATEMCASDPHVGDSFSYKNLYIVVAEMDDLCVTKLSVRVTPQKDGEDEEKSDF